MKKVILTILICLGVLLTAALVYAVQADLFIQKDKADEWISQQEAEKLEAIGKPTADPEEYLSLYERSLLHADAQQKKLLEEIDTYFFEYAVPDEMTKQIMMIMGDLPADTPCITLEQAEAILDSIQFSEDESLDELDHAICQRFNETAGAPDRECGSGIGHSIYFVNEEHTAWLDVSLGSVTYHPSVDEAASVIFDPAL